MLQGGNGSTGVIGKTQCHALTCVQVYILILKRNPIPAAAGAVIAIDRNRAVMRILNRISCLAAVNHISAIPRYNGYTDPTGTSHRRFRNESPSSSEASAP